MSSRERLAGKRCVVTGAARGIGEAISRTFAAEGADGVVTDVDDAGARRVAESIGGTGMSVVDATVG